MKFLTRLFRRKPRIVKVGHCSFPDLPVFETDFETLQKLGKVIYENNSEFFCLGEGESVVFRCLKDKVSPEIIPCENLLIHPDSVSVSAEVDFGYLALLAVRYNVSILETETDFVLFGPMCVFRSPKVK